MPRGGARPGSGPKKKRLSVLQQDKIEIAQGAAMENLEPLEYMLKVMNNPNEDPGRRDRMAVAAAPYRHAKMGEASKKDQQQQAADEIGGVFAVPPPPRLVSKTAN